MLRARAAPPPQGRDGVQSTRRGDQVLSDFLEGGEVYQLRPVCP
jgi:hypothetical protein